MPRTGELEKQLGISQERMDRELDPFMMGLTKTATKAHEALMLVEGSTTFTPAEKVFLAYHIGRLSIRGELNAASMGMSEKLLRKITG